MDHNYVSLICEPHEQKAQACGSCSFRSTNLRQRREGHEDYEGKLIDTVNSSGNIKNRSRLQNMTSSSMALQQTARPPLVLSGTEDGQAPGNPTQSLGLLRRRGKRDKLSFYLSLLCFLIEGWQSQTPRSSELPRPSVCVDRLCLLQSTRFCCDEMELVPP